MVDQLPNRGREAEMLQEMGLQSMEDLFSDIPADVRFSGELPLPPPNLRKRFLAMPAACWAQTQTWEVAPRSSALVCIEIMFQPPCSNLSPW